MQEYRSGIFALIVDDEDNVLVIQKPSYEKNNRNLIGGGREENETSEQNLRRELKEEAGLAGDVFELLGISTHQYKYEYPSGFAQTVHNGKYVGQDYNIAIVKFHGSKNSLIFAPEEISDHKRVPRSQLPDCFNRPDQYESFRKAGEELLNIK